jgi:hypothetical protein
VGEVHQLEVEDGRLDRESKDALVQSLGPPDGGQRESEGRAGVVASRGRAAAPVLAAVVGLNGAARRATVAGGGVAVVTGLVRGVEKHPVPAHLQADPARALHVVILAGALTAGVRHGPPLEGGVAVEALDGARGVGGRDAVVHVHAELPEEMAHEARAAVVDRLRFEGCRVAGLAELVPGRVVEDLNASEDGDAIATDVVAHSAEAGLAVQVVLRLALRAAGVAAGAAVDHDGIAGDALHAAEYAVGVVEAGGAVGGVDALLAVPGAGVAGRGGHHEERGYRADAQAKDLVCAAHPLVMPDKQRILEIRKAVNDASDWVSACVEQHFPGVGRCGAVCVIYQLEPDNAILLKAVGPAEAGRYVEIGVQICQKSVGTIRWFGCDKQRIVNACVIDGVQSRLVDEYHCEPCPSDELLCVGLRNRELSCCAVD